MTIRQYIDVLESIAQKEGDNLEVFQGDFNTTMGCIRMASVPTVREVAELSGRERNARYRLSHEIADGVRATGRRFVYVGR